MIAYLQGEIVRKDIDSAVIDVGGVGYGIFMISEDLNNLHLGSRAKIYVYEYIREQAYDLFGFIEPTTKRFFEQLLDVNGVGPKMAMSLLSIGQASSIKRAIAGGDTKYLQGANGVGKRVAERIVVDMKDKVGLLSSDDSIAFLRADEDDEAQQALIGLGFSPVDAAKALANIDKKLSTEERIKQALKERN